MKEEFTPLNCLKELEKICKYIHVGNTTAAFFNLGMTIQWLRSFIDDEKEKEES